MSITIDPANRIAIDNNQTGLAVTQNASGTVVYTPECISTHYKEYKMPHVRYSLSHDKPASGAAGKTQFENDIRDLVKKLNSINE